MAARNNLRQRILARSGRVVTTRASLLGCAQFLPILTRQRDHAQQHGQPDRATLFDGLIQRVETGPDTTKQS